MTVIRQAEAVRHEMHGATFASYVAPARGSEQLCAWRVSVPPGTHGQPHRVSHEEVFLVLSGSPRVTIDGRASDLAPGDVALVRAESSVQLDNRGAQQAVAWVSTSVGLEAVLADGTRVAPPWAG